MAVEIRKMLLTSGQGGRPGKKVTPKGLVIHWTANENPKADAVANRNYFENHPQNKVSAHYIVDDCQVVQCLPEDELGYHVGAKQYKPAALERLSSYPNDCTIGIEICVNRDGNFSKTYQNSVALAADILHRRGWGADRLWRHFDITGKDCPRFFVDNGTAIFYGFSSASAGWDRFKTDVVIALVNLQQGNNRVETAKEVEVVAEGIRLIIKGKEMKPDVPPQVVKVPGGDCVMVPLRFVSEALGHRVNWDGPTKTVSID